MEKNVLGVLRMMLYAVSAVILIATRFIRRLALSGRIQGSSAARSMSPSLPQRSYQRDQPPALVRYNSAMLVSLAMTESIGVFGLILFFLGKNETDLFIFILVSAVAMLFYLPKKDDILSLAQELDRQATQESGR